MSSTTFWTVTQIEPDCEPLPWGSAYTEPEAAKEACWREAKAICDESEIDADPCVWWEDDYGTWVGRCDETLTKFLLMKITVY